MMFLQAVSGFDSERHPPSFSSSLFLFTDSGLKELSEISDTIVSGVTGVEREHGAVRWKDVCQGSGHLVSILLCC